MDELQTTKLQLENEKTRLEIQSLKRPWWQRASHLAIILPFLIGIGSLVFAISSGLLDSRFERLKYERAKLDWEIIKTEKVKSEIAAERTTYLVGYEILKDSLDRKMMEMSSQLKEAYSSTMSFREYIDNLKERHDDEVKRLLHENNILKRKTIDLEDRLINRND